MLLKKIYRRLKLSAPTATSWWLRFYRLPLGRIARSIRAGLTAMHDEELIVDLRNADGSNEGEKEHRLAISDAVGAQSYGPKSFSLPADSFSTVERHLNLPIKTLVLGGGARGEVPTRKSRHLQMINIHVARAHGRYHATLAFFGPSNKDRTMMLCR